MSKEKAALPPGFEDFQRNLIAEFRANGGKVGGMFADANLCLLTTTGARTGEPRTTPLGYVEIDGQAMVVASAAGSDRHPAWYHNIRKNPQVTVEVGPDAYTAEAVIPPPAERDQLFAEVSKVAPGYADYQAQTDRVIPVVKLRRVEG
ncbi:nitroreductase family deazaflavin-dependent oxidoreductase [Actinoplanes sp. NPDC051475]|uniref:nitroreductase family deazaflavin-dependent oxidoreductase n=1 Tax=Actinoplanes sp. NPDC051475 TaxID=3157225 RepID=UPI00344C7E73